MPEHPRGLDDRIELDALLVRIQNPIELAAARFQLNIERPAVTRAFFSASQRPLCGPQTVLLIDFLE